ncbi:MAG: hypothetical protein Q4B78_05205 [Bacillota bacterium]|nr:hypothetical protein [Bacillota bacterium]
MRSSILVINTVVGNAIADGSVYPLPQTARRIGNGIDGNGEGVIITKPGFYAIDTNVTVTAGAVGVLTASVNLNGVDVPGAKAIATVTDGGDVTLPISTMVRLNRCENPAAISIKLSGVASTSFNASMSVKQV